MQITANSNYGKQQEWWDQAIAAGCPVPKPGVLGTFGAGMCFQDAQAWLDENKVQLEIEKESAG